MKWAAAAAGGSVLLARSYGTYGSNYSTTSTTFSTVGGASLFRLTFTAPASGVVNLKLSMPTLIQGANSGYFNWRNGSTDLANTDFRVYYGLTNANGQVNTSCFLTGLSGVYNLDVGFKVDNAATTFFGFLNNGSFQLEAWSA